MAKDCRNDKKIKHPNNRFNRNVDGGYNSNRYNKPSNSVNISMGHHLGGGNTNNNTNMNIDEWGVASSSIKTNIPDNNWGDASNSNNNNENW